MTFLDDAVGDQDGQGEQPVGEERDEGHVRTRLGDQADQTPYLAAFANAMAPHSDSYKQVMKELTEMLAWDNLARHRDWNQRIESMSGNVQDGSVDKRFTSRALLPTVTEVVR